MKKPKTPRTTLAPGLAKVLKRLHYPLEVILLCVRWYVAYSLSLRNLAEMMDERGIAVDHSTVYRWVIKLLPLFERGFRKHKHPVGKSWRMDESYIKIKGEWQYLYRAVDKAGDTVDFLLRARRDKVAARRFFEKAIAHNGTPETVTIDKSGSNLAALDAVNADCETPIKVRQIKYLNNIVEEDHRAIKRRTPADAGIQELPPCEGHSRRHRGNAHDQERTDEMCRQIPVVCFPAVLLPCVISNTYHIDISRPDTVTATEPVKAARRKPGRAPVQIGSVVEIIFIDLDTLSIEQDGVPNRGRGGIAEPERAEAELRLANAMHQLDA
ncbi:transposase-like protein [Paraburkholderia youngii]